jgi:hypothetical protein
MKVICETTLRQLYAVDNLSMQKIGKVLNRSVDSVSRYIKLYGITKEGKGGTQRIYLTSYELEVLEGGLLGDGCLPKVRNGNSYYSYGSSSYQHVKFVFDQLKRLATKAGIVKSDVFDKRTNKTYTKYSFRTQCNVVFSELRDRWYRDIKIVPHDLVLTNTVCLHWYIGDGCLQKSGQSQSIKLATNCFDVELQKAILLKGLASYEPRVTKVAEGQCVIFISRKHIPKFLNFIGDSPFSDYDYKWDYREYINSPPTEIKSRIPEVQVLLGEGNTLYKSCKILGLEYSGVRYHLKKLGVKYE